MSTVRSYIFPREQTPSDIYNSHITLPRIRYLLLFITFRSKLFVRITFTTNLIGILSGQLVMEEDNVALLMRVDLITAGLVGETATQNNYWALVHATQYSVFRRV